MIREAQARDDSFIINQTRSQPVTGPLVEMHWQIRKQNPLVPHRFFIVDGTAVLKLTGLRATLCGHVSNLEELASFLRFCGVLELTALEQIPPGWRLFEENLVMLRSPRASCGKRECIPGFDPRPPAEEVLAVLEANDGPMKSEDLREGFRADLALRRNHGFAAVYGIRECETLASTAGLYALTENEGYIACVETRREHRRKGYAGALLRRLTADFGTRPLSLFCLPHLEGFYAPLGFHKTRHTGAISIPSSKDEPQL